MAVHPYTVASFSTHRTLTTAGDTDVITLDQPYPQVQVVNDTTSGGSLTAYCDTSTGQSASYEPSLSGDGTVVAPGAQYTFTDDMFGAPLSVIRIRAAVTPTYHIYGIQRRA